MGAELNMVCNAEQNVKGGRMPLYRVQSVLVWQLCTCRTVG